MRRALENPQSRALNSASPIRQFLSPTKGWNTRDPLDSMPEGFALKMDNILPRTYYCELRGGQENWSTGLPNLVESFLPYTSPSSRKLFAASGTVIHDVSAVGAVGAPVVSALSNALWESTMFSGVYGTYYMMAVNGLDVGRQYDGATWANFVTTGVTSENFSFITQHKSRLWMVRKGSLSPYYLPLFAITGVATELNIGGLFKRGGALLAIGTLSIDGGSGPDDLICFITTEGECAVYAGADPATNFSLVGLYELPKPLHKRCLQKYGGDLLVLTQQGVVPLSKAFRNKNVDRKNELTYAISPTFELDAKLFSASNGWQLALYPEQNLLLANIPSTLGGSASMQYVMNTITNAWARWPDVSCYCMASFDGKLLFGGDTKIIQMLKGLSDFGNNITGEVWTAFSSLDKSSELKHPKLVRPHIQVNGPLDLSLAVLGNFDPTVADYQYGNIDLAGNLGGVWDSSTWDTATWAFSSFTPIEWKTIACNPSLVAAIGLRVRTKSVTVKVSSFDMLYEKGGVLG